MVRTCRAAMAASSAMLNSSSQQLSLLCSSIGVSARPTRTHAHTEPCVSHESTSMRARTCITRHRTNIHSIRVDTMHALAHAHAHAQAQAHAQVQAGPHEVGCGIPANTWHRSISWHRRGSGSDGIRQSGDDGGARQGGRGGGGRGGALLQALPLEDSAAGQCALQHIRAPLHTPTAQGSNKVSNRRRGARVRRSV